MPPPGDINELVRRSDAIVVGRAGQFLKEAYEGPYGAPLPTAPLGVPTPRAWPNSYYGILVERVLLDDANVSNNAVLRLYGRHDADLGSSDVKRPNAGQRFVFFLERNPDGLSYGVSGAWAMLNIDGLKVTEFNALATVSLYSDGKPPAAFIKAVEDAIAKGNG